MSGWVLLENVLQSLVTGLLVGGSYGLMCVGLGLIFSVMRVINFAQGEFLMLGMYATLIAHTQLRLGDWAGPYLGPLAAAIVAGVVVFGFGALLFETLLRRVTGLRTAQEEGAGHYSQLTLTLGLSLLLANGGLIVFGSIPRSVSTPLSSTAWEIPLVGDEVMLFLNQSRTLACLLALVVALAVALFITRARWGKELRAAADNPLAAAYMGIDVTRAHRLAFALGAAITAIAGGLLATSAPFQPYVGSEYIIVMYTGVVLGGMGSIGGAFWGGVVIGLIQQLSTIVLPQQLQNAAIFVTFLLILLLRPQGFFGRHVERV